MKRTSSAAVCQLSKRGRERSRWLTKVPRPSPPFFRSSFLTEHQSNAEIGSNLPSPRCISSYISKRSVFGIPTLFPWGTQPYWMLESTERAHSRSSSVSSTAPLPSFEDLAPPRPPLTGGEQETAVPVPGLGRDVKLKVDAGPGCGGIAWPAGEVSFDYVAVWSTFIGRPVLTCALNF